MRTYLPFAGRYGESDPVGTNAGINTFAYVRSSPTMNFDSKGLLQWSVRTSMYSELDSLSCLATMPGSKCWPIQSEWLALTVMRDLFILAPCEQTCDKKWKLTEYSVRILFSVSLRDDYKNPQCNLAWVLRAEMDHINDFTSWASASGRILAEQTEAAQQAQLFSSQLSCESTNVQKLTATLQNSFVGAVRATSAEHDRSNRHTCGHPAQRP
jgi:uncharacterized protein RhaS with RHS repeats